MGYGTLIYSLKHPELFAAAAPSSAVWNDDDMVKTLTIAHHELLIRANSGGKDAFTTAWYSNSVMKIVDTKTKDELSIVRYWIDCGDDDFLLLAIHFCI